MGVFPKTRKIKITVGLHKFCSRRYSAIMISKLKCLYYFRVASMAVSILLESWAFNPACGSSGRSGAALQGKARRELRRGTTAQVGTMSLSASGSVLRHSKRQAGWQRWPSEHGQLSLLAQPVSRRGCSSKQGGSQPGREARKPLLCGLSFFFSFFLIYLNYPFPNAH